MKIIITGGLGFIGSAVVRHFAADPQYQVLNIDKCTYAGNPASVAPVQDNPNYTLLLADITDAAAMSNAFREFQPDAVMHLAAESHVDRSIDGPGEFVHTNIVGTYTMLQATM
jgi:dTDP-glucose 4,6-dehydratase